MDVGVPAGTKSALAVASSVPMMGVPATGVPATGVPAADPAMPDNGVPVALHAAMKLATLSASSPHTVSSSGS
jgi:hypothetical protein